MLRKNRRYLNEGFGANSMERDPADIILQPDVKRSNAMMTFAGTSGTVPTHWNNSPFLSGGRLTSAFGLNPKAPKKKSVLSYHEFIKTTRGFQK
jgi:hypothetical protein